MDWNWTQYGGGGGGGGYGGGGYGGGGGNWEGNWTGDWQWTWDQGGFFQGNSFQIMNNGWETVQIVRGDGRRVINLPPGGRVRLVMGYYRVVLRNGDSFNLPQGIASISLRSRRYRRRYQSYQNYQNY